MAKITHRSPLAPEGFPAIRPWRAPGSPRSTPASAIGGDDDLTLIELAPGTAVAGVLTRSTTAGHPVLWCREVLPHGRARAVIVNAGNANVFRGAEGDAAVRAEAEAVAAALGCRPDEVLVASTGVIGERLPVETDRPRSASSCGAAGRRDRGRRPGDHDHGHLPQGGMRDRRRSAARP